MKPRNTGSEARRARVGVKRVCGRQREHADAALAWRQQALGWLHGIGAARTHLELYDNQLQCMSVSLTGNDCQ